MISETNYFWSLIDRAKSGNKNSFLELADIFKDKVYLHSLRLTGNCALAEKVTTKLFTKAWQHIKYLTPNAPFELWINGLTVSIVVSYYRKKKESNEPFDDSRLTAKSPAVIIRDKTDQIFLDLNVEQRLILFLHDYEGYTPEDCMIMFNEKHIGKLKHDLHAARRTMTDSNTIDLMNTFTDNEWGNFIQDFELWRIEELPSENLTDTLRILNKYRVILSNLLTDNKTPANILDGLKKVLFEESEKEQQKIKEDILQNKQLDPLLLQHLKKDGVISEQDSATDDSEELIAVPDAKERLRELRARRRKQKRILAYAAIIIFTLIDIVFLFTNSNFKSTLPWQLKIKNGEAVINGEMFNRSINNTDLISTGNNSEAVLSIPSIGKITLYANTKVKVLSGDYDDNRIELLSGKISLKTTTFYHRFSIEINGLEINDYGSYSIISLSSNNKGSIEVERGGIRIINGEKQIPVFEGYTYNFGDRVSFQREGAAADTLLYKKINKSHVNLEDVIEFVAKAKFEDAATLWTLFNYSDDRASNVVFQKLNEMIPIPKTATSKGIINKDTRMLNYWLEEIESRL